MLECTSGKTLTIASTRHAKRVKTIASAVDFVAPAPQSPVATPTVHMFDDGQYTGSLSAGVPEGYGTFCSRIGGYFEGTFKSGLARGDGVYHWADGRADVGFFSGAMNSLPVLALQHEGVRFSSDRSGAMRLLDGLEVEAISLEEAAAIAKTFGVSLPTPLSPRTFSKACVTRIELEALFCSPIALLHDSTKIDIARCEESHKRLKSFPFAPSEKQQWTPPNWAQDNVFEDSIAFDFEHLWWLLTESPSAKRKMKLSTASFELAERTRKRNKNKPLAHSDKQRGAPSHCVRSDVP